MTSLFLIASRIKDNSLLEKSMKAARIGKNTKAGFRLLFHDFVVKP